MRVMTMIGAAVLTAAVAGGAAAQRQVNETRETGPTGTVEVRMMNGEVRVIGWARNQVQVTGQLEDENARVELQDEGGSLVVRVASRYGHEGSGGVLEVRVPSRKDLEVSTTAANAIVQGVDGSTEVHSTSGMVQVSGGHARSIDAVSRSGSVDVAADADRVDAVSISGGVRVTGTVRDHVEAQSVSGEVVVTAASGSVEAGSVSGGVTVSSMRGRAEVHSVSGEIRVSGSQLSGEFQTVSGSIVLTGELASGGDLQLTSHSGDVVLQLARGASAQIDAGTFSGDISADYPGARVTRESQRKARIVVGSGDARVEVRTFSGDVKLSGR